MLSRGFSSVVSLLRASESRVFTAPMRGLHTVNGRALRPVSFVLSRRMSNQEASSTAGRQECEIENTTTCSEIKGINLELFPTQQIEN